MKKHFETEDFWTSISDMMSGLMIIFMFISISFMAKVKEKEEGMTEIAEEYKKTKRNIYIRLSEEFEEDLEDWNAYIDQESLSVSFREPDVFFKQGSSELNMNFKYILIDFFPRYIRILHSPEFSEEIDEIRIEGHTSTEWTQSSTEMESYFKNMELSQDRTRSTLQYVMSLNAMKKYENFMINKVTANGLSYSRRISVDGREDKAMSRRVEFKIRTKSEEKINDILERVQ